MVPERSEEAFLIAFLENNLCFDGEKYSVKIPEALRPYMGGKAVIEQK
jgi:seryl-tRNA synthetase